MKFCEYWGKVGGICVSTTTILIVSASLIKSVLLAGAFTLITSACPAKQNMLFGLIFIFEKAFLENPN